MYWKVVYRHNRDGPTLESAWVDPFNLPGWSVVYPPGEKAVPKVEGSKLYCFDNRVTAFKYARSAAGELWECEVENPEPCKAIASLSAFRMWRFWGGREVRTFRPPAHSILCDSITLTRKIWAFF